MRDPVVFLRELRATVESAGLTWVDPLVPHVDLYDDPLFEWWSGDRKLSIYLDRDGPAYLVSDPNAMKDGRCENFATLWRWLHGVAS